MGARVFVLADGTRATVPDESIGKWTQRMDVRGVKFRDADMSADMTVGEPQVIKGGQAGPDHSDEVPRLETADNAPPRAPDEVQVTPKPEPEAEGPGFWQKALDGYRTVSDGTAAALNTGTFGLSGRAAEALGGMSQRDMNARSPYATAIGSAGAAMFSPLNKASVPGQAVGLLGKAANVGKAALANGAMGAAGGAQAAYDDGRSPMQGAGWGAALGLLTGAGGQAIGEAAQSGGKLAGGLADRARIGAAGLDTEAQTALAQKLGISELPSELAAAVERITPSPRFGFSPTGRRDAAKAITSEVGPKIGAVLDEAGNAQGVNSLIPNEFAALQQSQAAKGAAAQGRAVSGSETAYANALNSQAERLGQQGSPGTLNGLRERNTQWSKDAYRGDQLISDTDSASRLAAKELRDSGEGTMDTLMSHALPETEAEFHGLNKEFSSAATLRDAAEAQRKASGGRVPFTMRGAAMQLAGGPQGLDAIANGLRAGESGLSAGGANMTRATPQMTAVDRMVAGLLAQHNDDEEQRH